MILIFSNDTMQFPFYSIIADIKKTPIRRLAMSWHWNNIECRNVRGNIVDLMLLIHAQFVLIFYDNVSLDLLDISPFNIHIHTYRVSLFNSSTQLSLQIFIVWNNIWNKICPTSNTIFYDNDQTYLDEAVFKFSRSYALF